MIDATITHAGDATGAHTGEYENVTNTSNNTTPPARKVTLRYARVHTARMSVYELWQKSGVFDKTIRGIESGTVKPRMATIRKLSDALGVEPESIDWPGDPLEMNAS